MWVPLPIGEFKMTKALRHMDVTTRRTAIARRLARPMGGLGTLAALDAEEREVGKAKAAAIRAQIVKNPKPIEEDDDDDTVA